MGCGLGSCILGRVKYIAQLQAVSGAANAAASAVEDMCVDLRGRQIAMAKQLLNGSDVVSVLEQMCGERMAVIPRAG